MSTFLFAAGTLIFGIVVIALTIKFILDVMEAEE